MSRVSGRIEMHATALDALHHGAGTSGNTSLLRMQDFVVDGEPRRAPFISGNSLKHKIRDAGVRYALEAMGVEDGTLSKPVVDLLFSGGSLSKGGTSVNLAHARDVERLFPILGVCGYSAGNTMRNSKIRVDNLHLVCEENGFRLPDSLRCLPEATKRAGLFRGEEFGTRHEPTRQAHVSRLLTVESRNVLEAAVSRKQKETLPDKGDSQQMISDFEVVLPGSRLFGAIHPDALEVMEVTALRAALSYACEETREDGAFVYRVGAKSSIGLGRVAMRFLSQIRFAVVAPAMHAADLAPVRDGASELADYAAHLHANRDAIVAALEAIV